MNRHSGSYKGDGVKKEKQGTLQSFARPKHYSEARAKEIINCIVAQDTRLMRVVEGQGFLKMLAYREPGYKVPIASRKHITSIIQPKHKLGTKKLALTT